MKQLTKLQAQKLFDEQLDAALRNGQRPYTDQGLHSFVAAAITVVAKAHPKPTASQIKAAKNAFKQQENQKIVLDYT